MKNNKQVQIPKGTYYFYKTIYIIAMSLSVLLVILYTLGVASNFLEDGFVDIGMTITSFLLLLIPVFLTQKFLTVKAFVSRKINKVIFRHEQILRQKKSPKTRGNIVAVPFDFSECPNDDFLKTANHSDVNNHALYSHYVSDPYNEYHL